MATRWNDAATAERSVDAAFKEWIKKASNAKRLRTWIAQQSHNKFFDPRRDLLEFEWTLRDQGSLGLRWVKNGPQGQDVGNTVVIQLKYAGKHKPGKYVVYMSYPK
ncbi:RNase A-like domain-containing protein [Streptomyces sp. NPDC001205]